MPWLCYWSLHSWVDCSSHLLFRRLHEVYIVFLVTCSTPPVGANPLCNIIYGNDGSRTATNNSCRSRPHIWDVFCSGQRTKRWQTTYAFCTYFLAIIWNFWILSSEPIPKQVGDKMHLVEDWRIWWSCRKQGLIQWPSCSARKVKIWDPLFNFLGFIFWFFSPPERYFWKWTECSVYAIT